MKGNTAVLKPNATYHIYNRANGKEKLFLTDKNYVFFLRKYQKYIYPVADTFCYCLMPNHFHFLIRIKFMKILKEFFKDEIKRLMKRSPSGSQRVIDLYSSLLSKRFSNFFNSYTKAFNQQNNRKGGLFMRPFKRKNVKDESYFTKLIHYIHYNPIAAGLTEKYDWEYSSYSAIITDKPTRILRQEVIRSFDDLENFIYCHQAPPKISGIDEIFKP